MEQKRLYPDMTAEQQLQWVTDFEALMSGGGQRIIDMARSRQPQWQTGDAQTVRRLVTMLAAWPFAQDFCDKAQRYGDYMARAGRLPVYVDKVMERLADGLTMQDAGGRTVAYVSPSAPLRRRGRPTREETAARLRGETVKVSPADDAEARKRRTIARMMGLEVVVSGEAPREKNNAELKAERDARRAEYERQNPSLFGSETPEASQEPSEKGGGPENPAGEPVSAGGDREPAAMTPQCPTMSEIYADRIETDRKLHMDQLKWLCSDALKRRIEAYHGQRSTFEDASTRAKTMAEMGAKPADIEPWAKIAEENLREYKQTEDDIDQELAILFKRLSIDMPFTERFKTRYRGVDVDKILYMTRPYYEKVKDQEKKEAEEIRARAKAKGENEEQAVRDWLADHQPVDQRVKNLIERDNPEYAAKMKAEEEKKEEVSDILRYLKRKDKQASDVRLKTAREVKFPRLVELIGEEEAKNYYPLITYIEEENRKLHEAGGDAASAGGEDLESVEPAAVPQHPSSPKPRQEKKPAAKKPSDKPKSPKPKAKPKQ